MKITYSNEQDTVDFSHRISGAIESAYSAAAELLGIDFSVSMLLTDAIGIAALNRDFRHKDAPTDVLSFPAYELHRPVRSAEDIAEPEWDEGVLFLGDVAISMERAEAQAAELGHSMEREMAFLALHGLLHLLGYDHMDVLSEEEMLEVQRKILEKAGIGR